MKVPNIEDQAIKVVQRQLEVYNLRDLDQLMALFAEDAKLFDGWTGKLIAEGVEEIRPRYKKRFETSVHCELIGRLALGNVVVDREVITGLPDDACIHCMAEYTVDIQTARIAKCVLYWDSPPQSE